MSIHLIDLPKDPLMEIFSHLPPQVLAGRVSLVCKKFRELALEPSLYRAYVKLIGKAEYEACSDESFELNFDGLVPIDMKTAVAKVLPFFGRLDKLGLEIEDDGGVAILDIPANISIPRLIAIAIKPKAGNPATIPGPTLRMVQTLPFNELAKKAVPYAYRIMISRGIIIGRSPAFIHMEKVNCRFPTPLEMCALALMTFVSSSKQSPVRLFEMAHSYCSERISFFGRRSDFQHFQAQVGFSPNSGLCIDYHDESDKLGTAVVRVLPYEKPEGEITGDV